MKKLPDIFGLSSEAILFDSELYIVKSVLAIATGYLVGKAMPITRLDMISVLLGVMYNLEPINIIGVKGGIGQLAASTLGAACTGILIAVFGINVITIAVSMALTLYVSLKINWRMVSPVAIFTCIYMTQFVQKDLAGNPSILLTFRLRIVALGVGVAIAIFYNYIFSFCYYRKIAFKRLEFARMQLLGGLEYTEKRLESPGDDKSREYVTIFPAIFNDLDMIYSNVELMISESRHSLRKLEAAKLTSILRILQYFRDINHLAYDINYTIFVGAQYQTLDDSILTDMRNCIDILKGISFTGEKFSVMDLNNDIQINEKTDGNRIPADIYFIRKYVDMFVREVKEL